MGLYNSDASFWYQMYKQKKIEQQAFSLCFSEPGRVDRKGTPAGAMVLGGTDTRLHKTRMVYAQQSNDRGKFALHLEKVYLLEPRTGEKTEVQPQMEQYHKVQIFEEDLNNRGPVILDSGTTATYLTQQLQRHFVEVFNSMVPEDVMVLDPDESFYELTLEQVKQLPTIVLQMKGWIPDGEEEAEVPSVTSLPGIVGADLDANHAGKSIVLAMPPSSYLTRAEDDDEIDATDPGKAFRHMFTFYLTTKSGAGGVIGSNFMRGYDILFDIDNSRIGFAESDCEYSTLVNDDESG
jgi:Eukaryotic aspartyl protease